MNYSSEAPDVPVYYGNPFPPVTIYGTYTACRGLCVSHISQNDADLCAQRQAKICTNEQVPTGPGNTPKPTYPNTPQLCTVQATGRQVLVPAGLFVADSQAEADAQALAYANKLQQDPATPQGPNVLPNPGPNPPVIINTIPTPTRPPPHEPPPPPTSGCKPCDDTVGVGSFSLVCAVPVGTTTKQWESPALRCGEWRFEVVTDDAGDPADPNCDVIAVFTAANPDRTSIPSMSLVDCPNYPMSWQLPCSPGDCTAPRTVEQFGFFPGCCSQTSTTCKYAECQTLDDGSHWLVLLQVTFVNEFGTNFQAKKFTVNGTWLGPIPTP